MNPGRTSGSTLAWKIRDALPPPARRRVRVLADFALAPVGSLGAVKTCSRSVALTFDDGPDPQVTPALLDLLAERNVRATFFLLTSRAAAYPSVVRRMVGAGHEVALHSDVHDRLTLIPSGELRRRLKDARALLEDTTGTEVTYFRPPFGAQSIRTYLIARACGLQVVVWGPHAEDWVEGTPEEVAGRGLANLEPGSILLVHDGLAVPDGSERPTFDRVAMFVRLMDGMEEKGLRPDTVSSVLAAGKPCRTAWFRP